MRVDKELVEQVVEEILGRLTESHGVENVLVLGSRNGAADLSLPSDTEVTRKVFYSDETCNVSQIDRYILPRLELADMVDLAAGKSNSVTGESVLNLLLAGKSVEVLKYAYDDYEHTAPSALYKLYSDYAETLTGFGLRPMQMAQKSSRLANRVISEKDIEKCHAEGVQRLIITGKAMVTSLADECAKKSGIEILRDDRGA